MTCSSCCAVTLKSMNRRRRLENNFVILERSTMSMPVCQLLITEVLVLHLLYVVLDDFSGRQVGKSTV